MTTHHRIFQKMIDQTLESLFGEKKVNDDSVVAKASFESEEDIRAINIPKNCSLKDLKTLLEFKFSKSITLILYQDPEGDFVILDSQPILDQLLKHSKEKPIRLNLRSTDAKTSPKKVLTRDSSSFNSFAKKGQDNVAPTLIKEEDFDFIKKSSKKDALFSFEKKVSFDEQPPLFSFNLAEIKKIQNKKNI